MKEKDIAIPLLVAQYLIRKIDEKHLSLIPEEQRRQFNNRGVIERYGRNRTIDTGDGEREYYPYALKLYLEEGVEETMEFLAVQKWKGANMNYLCELAKFAKEETNITESRPLKKRYLELYLVFIGEETPSLEEWVQKINEQERKANIEEKESPTGKTVRTFPFFLCAKFVTRLPYLRGGVVRFTETEYNSDQYEVNGEFHLTDTKEFDASFAEPKEIAKVSGTAEVMENKVLKAEFVIAVKEQKHYATHCYNIDRNSGGSRRFEHRFAIKGGYIAKSRVEVLEQNVSFMLRLPKRYAHWYDQEYFSSEKESFREDMLRIIYQYFTDMTPENPDLYCSYETTEKYLIKVEETLKSTITGY